MRPIALHDIQIRTELQPGDFGYLIYLHGKLYSAEYQFGIVFESYVAESLLEFCQNYIPETNRVWVCEHDQKMIGFMALMNRGTAAQLRYFIIDPAYRGIGLGKKLMELFMDFLKTSGYKSAYLLTTHELKAAASLYTRHGFKLTEEKSSTAFGKPLIEHRYELVIH
ncbi:MAG: GNAT family N-acetyltransferase [Cyclobacteriaceae bacterium]|nr:GNAT family N-acetyltransferase [Cyclobacteriaceae bacterium]